jgi:hypothetical protein
MDNPSNIPTAAAAVAKKANRSKTNLLIDMVIFAAFLFAGAPHTTGLAVHEWLGLAFGAGIVTHVLLHTQWVMATASRFFAPMQRRQRFYAVLNIALLIDIVLISLSGVMISRVALPALGIQLARSFGWNGIHHLSANLFTPLVAVHVIAHLKWIIDMGRRYLIQPLLGTPRPATRGVAPGR